MSHSLQEPSSGNVGNIPVEEHIIGYEGQKVHRQGEIILEIQ